jgi:hypothetical protein
MTTELFLPGAPVGCARPGAKQLYLARSGPFGNGRQMKIRLEGCLIDYCRVHFCAQPFLLRFLELTSYSSMIHDIGWRQAHPKNVTRSRHVSPCVEEGFQVCKSSKKGPVLGPRIRKSGW